MASFIGRIGMKIFISTVSALALMAGPAQAPFKSRSGAGHWDTQEGVTAYAGFKARF